MALINLRNALMSGKRLPYDAEVEYIESTGTQYIELPFNSTTDGFCDFDITYQMAALNSPPPFGYRYGASPRYGIWNGAAGEYYVGADASHSVLISQNTNVNTLSLRNGQYVDYNGTQTTVGTGTVRSNIGAILFGSVSSSSGATSRNLTSAKIQAFKLYNVSGVLLFDAIPVRKGTVGYLYDRVSGKLFGNAGTGDFVLGQDVVPATWVDGEYWNTFGVATALSGASRCDNFISVQPSSSVTFYLGARPGGTTLYMVQYNANKEREKSTYNSNGLARTVTIPANCYYIRVSVETAKKNEAYIHDNTNDRDLLRNGMVVPDTI